MTFTKGRAILILTAFIFFFAVEGPAQNTRQRVQKSADCASISTKLNGVYRIDVEASDRLYPIIESATSSVPYGDQQQFFTDLAVRLTPPDLLAIECAGQNRISLASSRSPRKDFIADGVMRSSRTADGRRVSSRIRFEREGGLSFSSGGGGDDLNFTFTPLGDGSRLRVTRRISATELAEPLVINTVYEKIGDVARWDVFENNTGKEQIADRAARQNETKSEVSAKIVSQRNDTGQVTDLRDALEQWIDATNRRDIEKQMSFYMPVLKSFYLTRNTSAGRVRDEKNRTFMAAKSIDISAAEPEIIFQDGGRTAVMRFRKKYRIENGGKSRSGEVVQELRWQRSGSDWKIFSERDIRVIR